MTPGNDNFKDQTWLIPRNGAQWLVMLLILAMATAFFGGLYMQWHYPNSHWWIASLVAGIFFAAGGV